MARYLALLSLALAFIAGWSKDFPLTILHTNDLHARMEPAMIKGKPYGGYARQATLIKQLRAKDKNTILLNAGDTFQGTLYFNVYEGLADLVFMNVIGYDAMAVGNHEFDKGPKSLATFARNARFPLLSANLDLSNEPLLKDLIKPSAIVTIGGQKIGIVGAITPDLPDISSSGPTVKMFDLTSSVQKAVDELTAQKINKIILVSHVGYTEECELAKRLKDVDVIVGGHSHTPLGELGNPDLPQGRGLYPTVINKPDAPRTLVVQAWEWGKVFGKMTVIFNGNGEITGWRDAKPIVVDASIPEDPYFVALVEAFQKPILAVKNAEVGFAENAIEKNSVMGEVIADAQLKAAKVNGAVAAFMNPGGVRAGLEAGKIIFGDVIGVQPFNNTLTVLDLTGAEIKQGLEQMAGREGGGQFLRISAGSGYSVDYSQPVGQRISNVVIAGEALSDTKTYRVVMNSFMAGGGDALYAFRDSKGYRYDTGMLDVDALIEYIKSNNPMKQGYEQRVKVKQPQQLVNVAAGMLQACFR